MPWPRPSQFLLRVHPSCTAVTPTTADQLTSGSTICSLTLLIRQLSGTLANQTTPSSMISTTLPGLNISFIVHGQKPDSENRICPKSGKMVVRVDFSTIIFECCKQSLKWLSDPSTHPPIPPPDFCGADPVFSSFPCQCCSKLFYFLSQFSHPPQSLIC